MEAFGKDSVAQNKGAIKNSKNVGMYSDGGIATNKKGGLIQNKGSFGMLARGNGVITNKKGAIVSNIGSFGMLADGSNSKAYNYGKIQNSGDIGISAHSGTTVINEKDALIQNGGDKGMEAYGKGTKAYNFGIVQNSKNVGMWANGGVATNEKSGVIQNGGNYKMYIKNAYGYNYGTITNVQRGQVAVQTINSDFYNSGIINVNEDVNKAIAINMIGSNLLLELGTGTKIQGEIKANGTGTLVVSSNATASNSSSTQTNVVKTDIVNGFNKLVASKGTIILDGFYKLSVVKDPKNATYRNKAYGKDKYSIDDVSGAKGNLIVNGIVNVGVDYDNITNDGTDKTGKIIANSIRKTDNGHIYLVNGGETTLNIIDEALKSNPNINNFRIKDLATVKKGAVAIDPHLFETTKNTGTKKGWKTLTLGNRVGKNGSLLIDQMYYSSSRVNKIKRSNSLISFNKQNNLTQTKTNIKTNLMVKNEEKLIKSKPKATSDDSSGTKEVEKTKTSTPTKTHISALVIPRSKVDFDSINRVTKVTNSINNLNGKKLKKGDNKLFLDANTTFNNSFKEISSYNFDYDVTSKGSLMAYLHQLTKKLQIGAAISYDDNNVTYEGVTIDSIHVNAPRVKHKEQVDSYNSQLFSNYEIDNFNIHMGIAYGFSKHNLRDTFYSGEKYAKYNSKLLKAGIQASYLYNVSSIYNIDVIPSIGVDYIKIKEGEYSFDKSDITLEGATSNSYMEHFGLRLRKTMEKFTFNVGATYEYLNDDGFYKPRKVKGIPMEQKSLGYDKSTISVALDAKSII